MRERIPVGSSTGTAADAQMHALSAQDQALGDGDGSFSTKCRPGARQVISFWRSRAGPHRCSLESR